MPAWIFRTDTYDIEQIANSLHAAGADFEPDDDQIVLGSGPFGYATYREGRQVCAAMNRVIWGGEGLTLKDWAQMSHSERHEILGVAAHAYPWFDEREFDEAEPSPEAAPHLYVQRDTAEE